MATLVLTVVGSLVGGPIGAAIGATIGQQIDQNILFAPKPRQGPRLGDLSVQTSSYGTQIPKIFGTMRIAGTVIWATDLIEHRSTSGGKGQPKVVNYAYTASFAVALSARPMTAIGRIWADGKLLRGGAGDFKSPATFRLHRGDEDQAADPLIAAAEGVEQTPGFRGIAYAVFEDMQLEDFGNRIPSLTFELLAEEETVPIGAIAEELTSGAVLAGATPALSGYAATGDSARGALEALSDVVPLSLVDDGAVLRLQAGVGPASTVATSAMAERIEIVRRGQGAVPGEVTILYYDIARDYQTGLQRAQRSGGRRVDRRDLPAVLDAAGAKALAEYRLASFWAGRVTGKAVLAWRGAAIRPGSQVAMEGHAGLWKVERWTLGAMTATLDLVRVPLTGPPEMVASAGRPISEVDRPHGPTIIHLLELPLSDGPETRSLVYVAAAGASAGWRRAGLLTSFDDGASWQSLGGTAAPATLGSTMAALPPAGSALFDTVSVFEVELLNDGMWLEGRGDDALVAGANLALVGDELIQFGVVEPLGDRRFRLSRLLRGRRGTEWATGDHASVERFVLIERESLAVFEAPAGADVRLLATGVGDGSEGVSESIVVSGIALRPPTPVHLAASEAGAGDLFISWVRRSRQGWNWISGADTPLGEESELYRLVITGPDFERNVETTEPSYLYTAIERGIDGSGPLTISVTQAGSFGTSLPGTLVLK
ncbi:MAG TPA: phage tail protein [Allosphingosinicella sp.]|nr:phage tail protein [Allosphingosinicella sp.]